MKKYKFLLWGFVLATVFSSCRKQLEEVSSPSALSESQVLTDPGAAQTLYNGVYGRFRTYVPAFFQLGELRSEIWADGVLGEAADGGSRQYYTQNISNLNVPATNWANLYNLLYQVNNVIRLFPQSNLPATQRDRQVAEMYGMRAYIYYTMLQTWGAVPLTTEPVTTIVNAPETFKRRTSADTIMIQIKADIEKSLTMFAGNNSFPSSNRVYWNRLATLTLKGDVFLWSGTNMGGGNADITIAKNALQEIIALESPTLQLNSNYRDIFDPSKKANNPEIIFGVNYALNQAENTYFRDLFTINGANKASYTTRPGVTTPTVQDTLPFVAGATRMSLTTAMRNKLISGPLDQRIGGTFIFLYTPNTTILRGEMLRKWIGRVNGASQLYDNDFPIYRYADVLLLMAEAKSKLGEDPSAEIVKIRARGYGAGAPIFVSGTITDNVNAVLEEGLREFVGEGRRWWALRRAGDSYVFANVPTLTASPTAKLLLPISLGMMTSDPLLTQTTGY